jgi:hypothetical protein
MTRGWPAPLLGERAGRGSSSDCSARQRFTRLPVEAVRPVRGLLARASPFTREEVSAPCAPSLFLVVLGESVDILIEVLLLAQSRSEARPAISA